MILTVTLNAALDVTYRVDRLVPHRTHRVDEVHAVAGGKGVNVARVLAAGGEEVVATGLTGGATGERIRADLATTAVREAMVEIAAESRRTVTVHAVEDGDATVFNEPGPQVTGPEWERFSATFGDLLTDARVVVLGGSVPPGLPAEAYGVLVRAARRHGARVVVDTSGPALLAAVRAGPDVVKPNADELADATGHGEPVRGAEALRAAGARAVLASSGPDGLVVVDEATCLRARPPERVPGNPTGAGDACVAAVADGLARDHTWAQILPRAVALAAAAVPMPRAGEVDFALAERLLPTVTLEVADAPGAHR